MKTETRAGKPQGWVGSLIDSYFGHLEKGKWIDITPLRYFWLKHRGYRVRTINEAD